jgi:hypothetical protein
LVSDFIKEFPTIQSYSPIKCHGNRANSQNASEANIVTLLYSVFLKVIEIISKLSPVATEKLLNRGTQQLQDFKLYFRPTQLPKVYAVIILHISLIFRLI